MASLENWMGNLPPFIREHIPIIYLAIPGSHNSMSYGVDNKSKLPKNVKCKYKFLNTFLPWSIRQWSKCQELDVTEQLKIGIR